MFSKTFRRIGIGVIALALGVGFVASSVGGCAETRTPTPATTTR